jgi:hypothetical protein
MSVRLFQKGDSRVNDNMILEALQADAQGGRSNDVYVVDDKATDTVKVLMNEGRLWELFSAATRLEKDRESRYSDYDQMEEDPIISSALELIVDDATQYSHEMNATLWVGGVGGKHKYQEELHEFLSMIDFENKVWGWTYNIAKYGDFFLRVFPEQGVGISNIRESEHPKSVYRVDIDGKLACFIKKDTSTRKEEIMDSSGYVHFINNFKPNFESVKVKLWEDSVKKSENGKKPDEDGQPAEYGDKTRDTAPYDKATYDVDAGDPQKSPSRHMIDMNRQPGGGIAPGQRKMVERILTSMYGTSVLQNARLIYRILNLLEVSLALARLARSPLIRVFYVNTEGMTKDERKELIRDLEQKFMQKKAIDIPVNFYRMKYNPLQYNDEVFIPYTGTKGDMRVETVGGDVNIKDIVDIEYIRDKLLAAIRIPGAFLGMSESIPGFAGSQTLTRLDIRYARMVKKVQRALIEGMYRLFQIHLSYKYGQNISVEDLTIGMVPISSAEEDSRLEYMERKIGIATSMLGLSGEMEGIVDKAVYLEYIFKQLFAFPDLDLDKLFKRVVKKKAVLPGAVTGTSSSAFGAKEGEGTEDLDFDTLQEEGNGSNGNGNGIAKDRANKIRNLVGQGFWITDQVRPSHRDLKIPALQERAKRIYVRNAHRV